MATATATKTRKPRGTAKAVADIAATAGASTAPTQIVISPPNFQTAKIRIAITT